MPRTVTGPPMSAPPAKNVPASMRSPTVVCSQGCSDESGTPSTSMVEVPAPSTRAPMATSMFARSTISGSRAAFSTSVVPSAATAAMSRFSVAPTLGNSSITLAPRSPCGVVASRKPWSTSKCTPSASRPTRCMSILRAPIWQPPGMATRAVPKRPTSGPSTAMLARILDTSSYGVSHRVTADVSTTSAWPSRTMCAPRQWSTSPMISMSEMYGTLWMTDSPCPSRAAAMSLSAEFLAPDTATSPRSVPLPCTMMISSAMEASSMPARCARALLVCGYRAITAARAFRRRPL